MARDPETYPNLHVASLKAQCVMPHVRYSVSFGTEIENANDGHFWCVFNPHEGSTSRHSGSQLQPRNNTLAMNWRDTAK